MKNTMLSGPKKYDLNLARIGSVTSGGKVSGMALSFGTVFYTYVVNIDSFTGHPIEGTIDPIKVTEPWLSKFRQKLYELRKLPNNWNGYESGAPNATAQRTSEDVLFILHEMDFKPTSLVASAEEGIGISFAMGEKHASVECFNDGDILAARYEGDSEPEVWRVINSPSEIKETLERIYAFIHGK